MGGITQCHVKDENRCNSMIQLMFVSTSFGVEFSCYHNIIGSLVCILSEGISLSTIQKSKERLVPEYPCKQQGKKGLFRRPSFCKHICVYFVAEWMCLLDHSFWQGKKGPQINKVILLSCHSYVTLVYTVWSMNFQKLQNAVLDAFKGVLQQCFWETLWGKFVRNIQH